MTNNSKEESGTCWIEKSSPKVERLPPWKVILHNDDVNDAGFVLKKIQELTTLDEENAVKRVTEAHKKGMSLLLTTHQERAELYVDQFETFKIRVTAEKAQ